LVKLGHVALDGTKIRANANVAKSLSYSAMKKSEPELSAIVNGWFEEAARRDREEDEVYGADRRGDELPDWIADQTQCWEKIRQAKAELEAEAQAERDPPNRLKNRHQAKPTGIPPDDQRYNLTDPDSRSLKTRPGFVPGYHAAAAVDSETQIMVAQS
jgi:hypothetical protein